MEAFAKSKPNVRVKKIEVGRGAPVAAQHGVRSLPHLVLYEGARRKAEGTRAVLAQLDRM